MRAARRCPPGDRVEHQPRPAEAAAGVQAGDDHAGHRAFDPRILRLQRAADERIDQPAADVGADRDRAAEVEHLDPRQAPQGVGRPGVAQLHAPSAH